MARRSKLYAAIDRLDRFHDSLVDGLAAQIQRIVTRASSRTESDLRDALTTDSRGRVVAPVAANQAALRAVGGSFIGHLGDLGYLDAVAAFRNQMPGVMPYFQETFEAVNSTLKAPLPEPKFRPEDQRYFESQRLSAGVVLKDEAANVARAATRQALISMGAVPVRTLTERLAADFGTLPTRASGLASTLISVHYRTIQNRAFDLVEEESGELLYRYVGPRDKLNRPVCKLWLAKYGSAGKPLTRKQIEALSNGSTLSNPFLHGGGYRCRHQWVAVGYADDPQGDE